MARSYLISLPGLNELTFHAMQSCPQDKKNELEPAELRHFKSDLTMRKFADDSGLEQKMLLLARIGIDWGLCLRPRETDLTALMERLPEQFKNPKLRRELIEYMNKEKIFFVTSREALNTSIMAAQNSHSGAFVLNYKYRELNQHLTELYNDTTVQGVKEAEAAFDMLSKIILKAFVSQENTESICGMNLYELQILLALYPYRATFVTRTTLANLIGMTNRQKGVAKVADKLEKKECIIRLKDSGKGKKPLLYTIAQEGINAVGKFNKYLLAQTMFQ